jgi:hypothetical protein
MSRSVSGPAYRLTRRLAALVPLLGLAALTAAPALQAQSSVGNLYDKWQIDLSGAMVIMGSTIRVDGANGEGTDVDSDVLGLSKSRLEPRLSVRWRPGHKHELELGYQFARRDAEKTLDREVVFNDSTYDVGANIKTNFRTDQAFLTYRYALKAAERSQLGLGVGIGLLPFKFEIDALGNVNGGEDVTSSGEKTFLGPTASVGGYGRWLLGERWYVETDRRGIKIKIDRLHASVVEANLGGRYFISPKFAADLGYGISSIRLEVDPRDSGKGFTGKIKYPLQHVRLGMVFTP